MTTTILVIEDVDLLREEIVEILEAEGYQVIEAVDGLAGVELACSAIPDLILCDVRMPQLDGYQTLKYLREEPKTATIPFIMLTAKTERANVRLGMELGADDYITKPFTTQELISSISAQLRRNFKIEQLTNQKLDALRSSISMALPHQLRTPLHVILGFSEVLHDQLVELKLIDLSELAKDIQDSANDLHKLIQNYLLYVELEMIATKPLIAGSTSSVQKIINREVEVIAKQRQRQADVQVTISQDAAMQIAEDRIAKIIEELTDNACKFSPKGTKITITGDRQGNQFVISFCNLGRGMTAEDIGKIGAYMQFERKIYEQQGTGLGLAIAKRITELHGGSLKIESVPNLQTTVTVTFPIQESPPTELVKI